MDDLSVRDRRAINFFLRGHTQKDSCKMAGFSPASARDVFAKKAVQDEIERRIRVQEKKTDMDREWLLEKLRIIIDADVGDLIEVDEKGRPSLNFSNLTPGMRKAITKITVDSNREGGKYKRSKTHVAITMADKLNAIKEVATLLGLRETKSQISLDEDTVRILTSRRDQLAKEREDGGN